jgi:cohesin loading factor subunit SCC2
MNVPNKSKKGKWNFSSNNRSVLAENSKKRKTSGGSDKLTPTTKFLYVRICELMTCFAELARFHTLTETTLHNLCSLSTPVFFIDSIPEIQIEAIRLLSTVFSTVSDIRRSVIQDILESLHRLPSSKNHRNCFRVTDNTWISNFAVLMLQLIQSVVKVPSKRKSEAIEETDEVQQNDITVEDAAVVESYQEAQSLAVMFLSGFLGK